MSGLSPETDARSLNIVVAVTEVLQEMMFLRIAPQQRRAGTRLEKSKLEKKFPKNFEKLKVSRFFEFDLRGAERVCANALWTTERYLYVLQVRDVKWVPIAAQRENFKLKIKLPTLKKSTLSHRLLGAGASPAHKSLKIL